ncbi:MAG: hypothetical protein JST12_14640 [Armatimonadetes bacterium]|nr:hypothetical protein [Armatimonadota bacterium]
MTRSQSRRLKRRKHIVAMIAKGFVQVGRSWVRAGSSRHRSYLRMREARAKRWQ